MRGLLRAVGLLVGGLRGKVAADIISRQRLIAWRRVGQAGGWLEDAGGGGAAAVKRPAN